MADIYDQLRAAWESADRRAELNRTVERLAPTTTRDELDAALARLLLEVRAAGADDETEEIINEVGDRLHGWCYESGRLQTKRADLPTEEEIARLPRWARVAFAARCARRVLPLHTMSRPKLFRPDIQPEKVAWAVEVAEIAAAEAKPLYEAREGYLQSMSGVYDAYDTQDQIGHAAANAAAYAAAAAGDDVRPERAYFACNYAAEAAQPIASIDADIRRDFDTLSALAAKQFWTNWTPVPPDVFGPLWPAGPPTGWPPLDEPPPVPQPVAEPIY